jgi:glycine/D-amino acid oxidase-like deaminating enzyme
VSIIGAGSFGGWTALSLLRQGFNVTLFDTWGPGNSRSSSGDETRVIRSTYGGNEFYFDLNVRALSLWKENEIRFKKKLFHNAGVLWLCYDHATPLVDDSLPFTKKHKMPYEFLTPTELGRRYPILNVTDLSHGYFDPFGGYLKAREATMAVVDAFINEGGRFIQSRIIPDDFSGDELRGLRLENGERHHADLYIFACGSWLSNLFPGRLDGVIRCSKQEVYYFGTPASEASAFDSFPVWIDADGEDFYYGIPNNAGRGFKIGVDRRGESFDPTSSERNINPDTLEHARQFLGHRFPSLENAPLLENRVCPYENSSDGNFIFDLLPGTTNTFILGGGSGHGFKHGPALGELITRLLKGELPYPEILRATR